MHCLQTVNLVKPNCGVATTCLTSIFCGGLVNKKISNEVVQFDGIMWKVLPSMNIARCGSAAVFYKGIGSFFCFMSISI